MAARYAIYFAPERGTRLQQFGNRILGRDSENGEAVAPFVPDGIPESRWQELTASARRYGFHATLKAPFTLAPGRTEDELKAALHAFAGKRDAFKAAPLNLNLHENYAALVLSEPDAKIHALAEACVSEFDPFRAPISDADRARRRPDRLTDVERSNLDRWGYPYVFETFIFHMTLAGPLPPDLALPARDALRTAYAQDAADVPLEVRSVSLFVEPEPGAPFLLAERANLRLPG